MEITRDMTVCYRLLAERYLAGKFSLKELDEKFFRSEACFIPKKEHTSSDDLRFFTLVNEPDLSRLDDDEKLIIRQLAETGETQADLIAFMEGTYRRVLAGNLIPGARHEFFRDIHGRGIFPAQAIVFRFFDELTVDADGKTVQSAEKRKTAVFDSVRRQYENILRDACPEDTVCLIRI